MDRRRFLKLGALTASTGMLGACGQTAQQIVPFVNPPDDGVNPVDGFWYATTCKECNAGCGVMIRTVDGRAKKLEGNPGHPISGGKACATGQAGVQKVYHPDRLKSAMLLSGERGSGVYKPISWTEAVTVLSDKLAGAKGSVFFLNNGSNDVTAGVANAIFKDSEKFVSASNHDAGAESLRQGGAALTGLPQTPYPDMANADFSLLLGADIFEWDRSPVFYSRSFGASRRDRPSSRGRMVYMGSRLSSTAVSCDKWIPAKPGQLGIIALSIASVVVDGVIEKGLARAIPRNTLGRYSDALRKYRPERVAEKVDVDAETLYKLAAPFVNEAPAIVIAGDGVTGYSNGVAGLDAVELLNMISYEIGKEKLTAKPRSTPESDQDLKDRMLEWFGPAPRKQTFAKLKSLTEKMAAGEYAVGLIHNTNPVFDTPNALKFKDALGKVAFVVSFANVMDETANQADLILPDNHWLEGWSAQIPDFVPGVVALNLGQPVVQKFQETKAAADSLLEAGAKAGLKIPAANGEEYIKKVISAFRSEMLEIPPALSDKEAWNFLLRRGGSWPSENDTELTATPASDKLWAFKGNLASDEPVFEGTNDHPYHLHIYQTVFAGRGSGVNHGWLQESPDPITTVMWQWWIEINTGEAGKLGINEGDLITVSSVHGSVTGPAYLYQGLRPDVISIPAGFGHTNYGEMANGRGANAMDLLGLSMDEASGGLAARSQMVSVKKAGGSVVLLRNGNPDGEDKGEAFQL